MDKPDFLKKYREKRNFDRTSEPFGSKKKSGKKQPIFVIQKHNASQLHYDFRLEVDNVLKSWSVPKGPSTDPSERRLAVRTEDHPIDYADFEGVIPEDQYGAGTVMVWDAGTYESMNKKDEKEISMKDALNDGHVVFKLKGKKISGGYALIQKGKGDNWFLIKMNDDEADARRNPVSTEPRSVLTKRTLEEIRNDEKNAG
ncbi:MAG: DNA ligase [Calditrichaeota bacterium]|nr:DNA ligase [Calditrichota bacterium]RQW01139.1 MAG: DNA ligase [Calditrichota bacterium]